MQSDVPGIASWRGDGADVKPASVPSNTSDFADAVRFYLQLAPRQLPSRFLYDALGSALFDAIGHLPWYRITRAERAMLELSAASIGEAIGDDGRVVELGCGNGEKLAKLLRHVKLPRVHAHLVDLSCTALTQAVQALDAIDRANIRVTTHHAAYEDALRALPTHINATVVAFLGSNIGNFDPSGAAAFLRLVRTALREGDGLLLGTDLVKEEQALLLAYDDPLGVTAAFNKNLLWRINTELEANFELERFAHRAVWNQHASRIEMHLVSLMDQHVRVSGCDLEFDLAEEETIWTESSYKYDPSAIRRLVEPSGFVQRHQWIDEEARFALTLFETM